MSKKKASSSNSDGRKKSRRLYLAIPIVAVVLVAGVFAIAYFRPGAPNCSDSPSKVAAMDFQSAISIKVVNRFGNESIFIAPRSGVGVYGAAWATHQYDQYGIDGKYPLCSDPPNAPTATAAAKTGYTLIYVRSTVQWNFTVRDFFNVWGQPYGQNQTLDSAYLTPKPNYVWQLCISSESTPTSTRPGNWTYEPLVPSKYVSLVYFPNNTAYPGCA